MPKQIIDITTPEEGETEEIEETEEQFPVVLASVKSKKTSSTKKRVVGKSSHSKSSVSTKAGADKSVDNERIKVSFSLPKVALKIPLVILIVVVVFGGAFLYLTLQAKAQVTIKPILEPIKIENEIQASSRQTQIDFEKKIIPSQLIGMEMEKRENFKSTGKGTEQSGAFGVITVYNSINPPRPISLKEGTRFVSSKDGKIYKAKNKISLPGATLINGKVIPSATEVQVVAQQQGEEYNIAPAKFSVPGLVGTASYYNVWGESKEKIEGGSQKEVEEITQQDMDAAQDSIIDSLKADLITALKEQVPSGFYLNQEAINFNEPEVSCSQEVGARVAGFSCYLKFKAQAMIFREADLQLMAKNFVESKLSPTKKLQEQSLVTSIKSKGGITENGALTLDLKVEANLYNAIDIQELMGELAGKSRDEISILLKNDYPQIEKIDVKTWPFWIQKTPKNLNKINADIIF